MIAQKKFSANGPSDGTTVHDSIYRFFMQFLHSVIYLTSYGRTLFLLFAEDSKFLWNVPITISTSDSPNDVVAKTLLETDSSVIEIKNLAADKWIKVQQ